MRQKWAEYMQGRESQLPSNFYLSCGHGSKGQTPGGVTLSRGGTFDSASFITHGCDVQVAFTLKLWTGMETCFGGRILPLNSVWCDLVKIVEHGFGQGGYLLPWLVTGFSALIDGLIVLSFPRSVKKLIFINSPLKSGASSKAKQNKTKQTNLEYLIQKI